MRHLLLTLGHNSSAILLENGKLMGGYEEERLTGVKSDSRFPIKAINRLIDDGVPPDAAYVTHWEPTSEVSQLKAKYWMPELFDGIPVRSHSDNTHHDTHAFAALSFAGPEFPTTGTYILVVDGFGSYGEHFSLYKLTESRNLELQFRARGYDTSLGLMYQYATAFLGMKMHEDEYKLLGYEVHVSVQDAEILHKIAEDDIREWCDAASMPHLGSDFDPIFNLNALDAVRERFFKRFGRILSALNLSDPTAHVARAAIAYYVQSVLEGCVIRILDGYPVRNLIMSGGCFYNVKLNKILLDHIPGYVCAYPLAGDQGNALGLYSMDYPSFKFPDNLYWGHRSLQNVGEVEGLIYIQQDQIGEMVSRYLEEVGFVNLVRGSMEFGPRALCNTSTLAIPDPKIVDTINGANNRNTVMPMAPVMTKDQYEGYFYYTDRVWKSHKYMIMAMEYRGDPYRIHGAAHYYKSPFRYHWTGRPQVIDSADPLAAVVEFVGPLINTSFNFHGKPIAFDMPSIIENHLLQYSRNPNFRTLVVTE